MALPQGVAVYNQTYLQLIVIAVFVVEASASCPLGQKGRTSGLSALRKGVLIMNSRN